MSSISSSSFTSIASKMSQLQHPQLPQQPSQAVSHAVVPSQPIGFSPTNNVNNHHNNNSPSKIATIISQNSDQQLIASNNNQHPLELNSRPPIETPVPPVPRYQYHQHQPTSHGFQASPSATVDLAPRFAPSVVASAKHQQSVGVITSVPYQYYQTQHYYSPTHQSANANYHNSLVDINYTSQPSSTHSSPYWQPLQPQQPRHFINGLNQIQFINGYQYSNGHTSYPSEVIHHRPEQTPNKTYYLNSTTQPQSRTMEAQTAPGSTAKSGPKLIWLLFMHRHGDRTPLNMAPRDKYNNITYWPEGFGNLNNAGRMRMFKMGKFIRRRYDGFLTDNVREVYSRSSDVDRCIESSHALLAGLYPPTSRFEWNKDLHWVPAPVHTVPGPDDYFLGSLKVSYTPHGSSDQVSEFINEIHLIQNSEAVKKLYEDSVSERELLERELGYEFDMFHRFKCTYSTLDIEERNGLDMPVWYTPELKQKLYRYAGIAFSLAGGGTEKLKKIRCGHLMEDLVSRMEMASIEGPKPKEQSDFQQLTDAPTMIDDRKIVHYSTHDSNMAAFLEALGVNTPTPVPPAFGATFFVELYVDLNEQGLPVSEKYIRLFYMDDTDSEKPVEKMLPNAMLNEKGQLTLNNFRKYVKHLLPGGSGCKM